MLSSHPTFGPSPSNSEGFCTIRCLPGLEVHTECRLELATTEHSKRRTAVLRLYIVT
ncbi:uncharacterized protein BDV17DRAFT_261359 [Aspergillus undulatus]|uniref:uncharacterized protein n=1 Tax=Aspergillus undulatus TaxID=1810928 RepID=UPI003CCDDA46